MSYSYGHEQLIKAVDTLIVGTGRIKERLADAYNNSLHLIGEAPYQADLPLEYMARWENIKSRLTTIKAPNGESDLEATLDSMLEDEASIIARDITNLEFEVDSWIDNNPKGGR